MLFESYKDFEYDRKKLEVEQEFHTPQTTFLNAFQINLTYRDVLPFIKDEDRRLKLTVLKVIVSYCKTLAKEWKIDAKFYENYSNAIEKPNDEYTHTFYFYQYLDEWSLAIYSKGKVYNYALSDSAKQKVKKLFTEYQDVEQMITVHQSVTIAEADTVVMIKLLYQICLKKELKVSLNLETLTEWRQQIRIVDLFLFEMHKKQLEMQNKSKQDPTPSQEISFVPDEVGQARSFASKPNKSVTPNITLEKELSRSRLAHAPVTDEMIELTQEEFQYMMEKFKESVIEELQKIQPQDPAMFLQKYLKGNGELRVRKNEKGQEELIVNIKGDQLQTLLKQYEKYYEQKINEQQYTEQQEKAKVQYQQYMQFQQLLNYYYQTDPEKYSKLVSEYYKRLNQQTLKKLEPLLQQGQQSQQEQSQSQEQSFQHKSLSSLPSPFKQNLSYQSQDIKQTKQPSFNVSLQNLSHQSLSIAKIDKQHLPSPFNSIIAQRYTRSITQAELNILMTKGQMTENSLNFFIRYLEEKQTHQPQETLKQFRIRTFFLSTTFYRALQTIQNNPDQIQYAQAQSYTKKYIGRDNTIFDQFDIILIPIVVGSETILININLAQETIIFYDTILNGLGAKSMATSLIAQNGLLTNPYLLSCLRFLEVEHNQKLMKPLSLLKWQVYYSPHEKLSDISQSNALAALLISQISSGKLNKQKFSSQLELAQFIKKLQQLYYQIGITKNRKNELNFEQMTL